MDAKKCDRCGKFYIIEFCGCNLKTRYGKLSTYEYDVLRNESCEKERDLCPDCMKSLFEWFRQREG